MDGIVTGMSRIIPNREEMATMTYEPGYVTQESDLIDTGSDEPDDFDPALDEWAGMDSEHPLDIERDESRNDAD